MSLSHYWHKLVNELILLVIFVSGNDFVNVIVLLIIRSYVDMSLRSIFGKATMHLIPQDSLSVLMWAVRESYNNIVYYPQVLCQPLFQNYTNNLSSTFAHWPYQKLIKITLFPGMVRHQSQMEQVRLSEHIENQVQNSCERACTEDKHRKPARFQWGYILVLARNKTVLGIKSWNRDI